MWVPAGVLPEHYTSLVIERSHLRLKDHALREFLDLFNHRLISLYFRAWEKYRFPVAYERHLVEGRLDDDLFTLCLFCLIGMGSGSLRDHFTFDDQVLLLGRAVPLFVVAVGGLRVAIAVAVTRVAVTIAVAVGRFGLRQPADFLDARVHTVLKQTIQASDFGRRLGGVGDFGLQRQAELV